ncbi:MAG TPA: pseudouridine synthase [Gammaproteobacteria bacterium]|nr:pseudouridine synthase [Gammaproteobacteria bacterium]
MSEKIQKVLAKQGLGSRREIEQWIREGRVKVHGKIATLGDRIEVGDPVLVDNRPVVFDKAIEDEVLLYHKPEGELCTRHDPEGRIDVFSALPPAKQGRWVLIGRLDLNTSGLLLLTTNGELAHRLMHPSYEIEREYAVRVLGTPSELQLVQLLDGVLIDGLKAKFVTIEAMRSIGANTWYRVVIMEGRQREVRRLWQAVGLTVSRLIRIRFGPVLLPKTLDKGRFIYLSAHEIKQLKAQVGL